MLEDDPRSTAIRLNLALAAARLGDWAWDARTDVVTCSPRAAAIFDIPPGPAMTWEAMRGLLHPDDRERAREAVARAVLTRTDYTLEYRLINGGRERWVTASGRGHYDVDGQVLGMFGVVQDISGDRLLVRLDDAVRSLVRSEDITSTAARVLGEQLRVHRCAYAFVEDDEDTFTLTGNYTNGVDSIVGRYRFRQFGAECLRLMRAGAPYVVEDSLADPRIDAEDRRAYQQTTIRAVICVPILKSGRFVAAMAVHMNERRSWTPREVELVQQVASRCWESIERSRVEREREALLAGAEAANRAKDEFLAMLGHELRNPLAPILTALKLIELRGDGAFARERTVIERQVNHLTRLVDDLLDVSRIARGKVELKMEPIELSQVVTQALEVVSPLLEQREHSVTVDVPRAGLRVAGDTARLTQVVSNLLTNAAKYTPPGGHVHVEARAEPAHAPRSGEDVILRVRDSGVGITEDVLPHVFDLFVQGTQTIERARGGLGLGLSIVRSLVQRHGGSVAAYSEGTGKGAELVVRLPMAAGDVAAPSPERADAPARAVTEGRRVLLVDDNEDAAEMLAEALSCCGCSVRVAHDALEALENVGDEVFDLALLDIGLPVMDGYELAARLRELPSFGRTRLVAVTGYGQEADRQRALAAGFHRHLVKPVHLSTLEALFADLT